MTEVVRDPQHCYFVDGAPMPGVTSVISGLNLVDNRFFTEEGRTFGSYVHDAIALHLAGTLDPGSIHARIAPRLAAAVKFLAESEAVTEAYEEMFYCPTYGYCGTRDWRGLVMGQPTLIDWKNGAVTPYFDSMGMQTAGYAEPLSIGHRRIVVQLREDGEYRAFNLGARDDAALDRPRFLSALDLYRTFIFKRSGA